MAKDPTPEEIEQMRAKVVAHDQAEAKRRREEKLAKVQPVLDAADAATKSFDALKALLTPELAAEDQDLWDRLRTWSQTTDSLMNRVEQIKATPADPIPLVHGAPS